MKELRDFFNSNTLKRKEEVIKKASKLYKIDIKKVEECYKKWRLDYLNPKN